jgi:hypothetical protein
VGHRVSRHYSTELPFANAHPRDGNTNPPAKRAHIVVWRKQDCDQVSKKCSFALLTWQRTNKIMGTAEGREPVGKLFGHLKSLSWCTRRIAVDGQYHKRGRSNLDFPPFFSGGLFLRSAFRHGKPKLSRSAFSLLTAQEKAPARLLGDKPSEALNLSLCQVP